MTRRTAGHLAAALAAVAATTWVLVRSTPVANHTTVALALLLVVLAAAALSSRVVAVVTSVAAMLAFNYFVLPPVGTLTIADPENWVALFTFLAVALIGSHLSATAKQRAMDAVARRQEVGRLFDLSRDILLSTDAADAVPLLARYVARRFELGAVAICLPEDRGWRLHQGTSREITPRPGQLEDAFARLRGTLEYDARERAYGGYATVEDAAGRAMVLVPIRLGARPTGLLATDAEALEIGTLDALGGVVAIAVERANFLREREAAQALQQRADLASALLASFSHDLRTPLTAIRIAVANLREGALPESDRREQATLALTEVDRLNRLIQDILDTTRIDAGALAPEPEWVAPADLVDAAVARTRTVLASRKLVIESEGDQEVRVDPKLTANALAHLLENAAQYSPADQPIEVRGWAAADGLHLIVRDHGPGLDPAEMDHLFERFFRGKNARVHTLGTGMGLAITRGLLAAEGGSVWVENCADGGAAFTIVVPARVRVAEALT